LILLGEVAPPHCVSSATCTWQGSSSLPLASSGLTGIALRPPAAHS
jgi:hypothetical protein